MKYIFPTLCLFALIPLMLFSATVKEALPDILYSTASVVLGVLFPSSVLLRTFCFSPAARALSDALSKTSLWKRTGLSSSYLPSVIAGQLCGFPMTACLLPSGENRENALALGSVVSPAFLTAVLGVKSGLWLWTVQLVVLYAIAIALPVKPEREQSLKATSSSFSEALSSSCSSAVAICGTMIFFSCMLSLLPSSIRGAAAALLEIGSATRLCSSNALLAAALSFGGLSILSQISFCAQGVSLRYYLSSRVFLFIPTLIFLIYPKMRIFVTILALLLLLWQITRRNTCKNQIYVV